MNEFCENDCVGGNTPKHQQEIVECNDTDCPFYNDRYDNLKYQNGVKEQ